MKQLTTEAQSELQELLTKLPEKYKLDSDDLHQLTYWSLELKPKRIRRKDGGTRLTGLDLNTDEGVIEQAYQEHTGNF